MLTPKEYKGLKSVAGKWTQDIISRILSNPFYTGKMIINKRFFNGKTQMEVAKEIGISQAQVSRLEKNAIEHIKRLYK